MAIISMLIVTVAVAAFALGISRLGLAFTLSLASQAARGAESKAH